MRFEVGKFYMHERGRMVAVIAEVKTYKWGPCYVVEEADGSGHSTSIVEVATMPDLTTEWVEIGRREWMKNFKDQECEGCGKVFVENDRYVVSDEGYYHSECYAKFIASGVKPSVVEVSKEIPQDSRIG
uniref:Uncharacterized protein n=1 Tax=viral metagenome TaxID=1070528 RepID=A0A6M3L4D8_9ZZZZ